MNKDIILKEILRSQDFNFSSLLEFFKSTNELVKGYSDTAEYIEGLDGQIFILGWIKSIKDSMKVLLSEKLKALSQGLLDFGFIEEDKVDLERFQETIQEMNMSNQMEINIRIQNLMKNYLKERGLIFEPKQLKILTRDMPIQCKLIDTPEPPILKKIKNVMTCGEDIKIKDFPCTDGFVQSTIVSKTILYYVSFVEKNKFFKYDIKTGQTTEYPYEDLAQCVNIDYNQSINRVFITVKDKGVFQFEPGKENETKKSDFLPIPKNGYHKMGMTFNGVQGLIKDLVQVYYCSNLLEDKNCIKLNIEKLRISGAVFLDENHAAVLYHNERKIVVLNLSENKQVSEITIHDECYASSISIDKERQRIVVSVRENVFWCSSSSWGCIYHFKVIHQPGQAPLIVKQGQPIFLGGSNNGVYDMKMTRISRYHNKLIVLVSISTYQIGKKQVRLFHIDESLNSISEIFGIPEIVFSRRLIDIKEFEGDFIVGCDEGGKLAYLSFN